MNAARLIGILGGTFDPVHCGHLHVANSLLTLLPLDEVRLLPCYQPVHRASPIASPEDRLAMLKLACAEMPNIVVDDHEIKRQGQSYMIDTLADIQRENPTDHLCLILGEDAFQSFDHWRQWRNIIDYCHLIIVNRPQGSPHYSADLLGFISQHEVKEFAILQTTPAQKIFFCAIPPADISATQLRQQLLQRHFDIKLISQPVSEYIRQHRLYL
jgi:nicotinate-nucleotide adenylyltransferase